ncbi:hypothetical protein TQ38_027575 (plasmid) [Novosphingobium sp. P6W]|nr:hypothetical protein TQ38_027575 [Novosphingobium sp. P6W]
MPLSGEGRFELGDRLLEALRSDGVFVPPPLSDDLDLVDWLSDLGLRCARIARSEQAAGVAIPTPDRVAGAHGRRLLMGQGQRHIATVKPPHDPTSALQRTQEISGQSDRGWIGKPPALFVEGAFDFESGMRAGEGLLEQEPRPTAILAPATKWRWGCCLSYTGVEVPQDRSIFGFNATPGSLTSWPSLTTVRRPLEQRGRAATDPLCNRDGCSSSWCAKAAGLQQFDLNSAKRRSRVRDDKLHTQILQGSREGSRYRLVGNHHVHICQSAHNRTRRGHEL